VRSLTGADLVREYGIPAVIVGSSPCQEFSYRAMPWKRAKALGPPVLGIELFQAQFRIQREISEAAGQYVPMVVENVRGAQKWIGRARWHFGSYYLWGDVPALMPHGSGVKLPGNDQSHRNGKPCNKLTDPRYGHNPDSLGWSKQTALRDCNSKSPRRRAASALIAKIPFPLAQHIARCFKPEVL